MAETNHDLSLLRLKLYFNANSSVASLHNQTSPSRISKGHANHQIMHSRSRDSKKYTSTRQTHQKPIETCGAQGRPYVYQIRKLDFKQDEIRAGKGSVHSRNSSKRSKSSTPAGVSRVKEWMQELPDTPTLFVTEVVMPPEERASSRHRGIARTTHFVHEKSHAKSFTVPHEGSITRQVTTTTISANQQYSIQDALSTNHQSQAISNLEKPLPKSPSNPNSPTTDVEPAHLMIGEPGYNTRSRNTMEIVAVSSPPTFPTSAIPAADPTIRKKPSLNFVWLRPPNSAQNSEPINGDGTSPTKKWGRSFIKGLFDSSKPSNTVDASNVPRETRRGRSRSRGRNGAIIESANSEKSTAEAASYWSMIKDSVSTMSTSIKQGSASRGRSLARDSPKCTADEARDGRVSPPFTVIASQTIRGRRIGRTEKAKRSSSTKIRPPGVVGLSPRRRAGSVPPQGDLRGRPSADETIWQVVCNYADIALEQESGQGGSPSSQRNLRLNLAKLSPCVGFTANYDEIKKRAEVGPLPSVMPKLSTAAIPLVQYPTIPLHPSHLRAPGRARYSFESDRIESVIESSIGEALSFVGHSRDFSDVPVDFLRFHRRASENTSLDDTATRRSSSHKSTTTTLVGTSDRALPKLPSRSSRTTTSSQIQEEADEDETVSELYENSCEAETLARDRTLLTRRTVGHGDVDGLQSRGGISSRCDDDYVGMIKMRDLDDFDGDSCVSSIQQDGGRRDGAEAGDWWTLPRN